MAAIKKRKHASIEEPSITKQTQQNIKAFGKVTKQNSHSDERKKRKIVPQEPVRSSSKAPIEADSKNNKRKRGSSEEPHTDRVSGTERAKQAGDFKSLDIGDSTPRNKRFKGVLPPSPKETPSKSATALFDRLKLGGDATPIPFSLTNVLDTPPDTPKTPADETDLPREVEQLLQLHAAFLAALSLYYAHNGTSSAVDVRALLPMITKKWRKRAVTLDDLRVLLAVPDSEPSFVLKDFGRAGICLVKLQPRGRATKRIASFVDEVELNDGFEKALQRKWVEWRNSASKENRLPQVFLDQLPLVEITQDESVQKTASLFARGQQRLTDLKSSQATSVPAQKAPTPVSNTAVPPGSVQNRGTSLLDRILAKQANAANLPAGPTKAQIERKAALHRVEDIARVLDLLATGRPRCSFSMQAMVQQLQQSIRSPISKEEVQRCLEIMAVEVTPGFVSLVRNGTITGVVITKSGKIGGEELKRRVQVACEPVV
jgi:hypothetical protein